MTRLTDGKVIVEIVMNEWENGCYTPDWSHDFFEVGNLTYNDEKDAYIVKDVNYCIEQAKDWRDSKGDFQYDTPNKNNNVLYTIYNI